MGVYITHELTNVDGLDRPLRWSVFRERQGVWRDNGMFLCPRKTASHVRGTPFPDPRYANRPPGCGAFAPAGRTPLLVRVLTEHRILTVARRAWRRKPKMGEGALGEHAAARRTRDEALLQQIGLDDLLDGVARLRQRRGDGLDADRTASVIHGDAAQIAMIERVEPAVVHFELRQRAVGDLGIDRARTFHGSKIADAP